MPAHSHDTKTFPGLDKGQQARSINAMLINIERAIEHRIRIAEDPVEAARIRELSVQQILRLAERLGSIHSKS